ncbi:MAG: LptF/LptG family permease [Elusimicrobia bacterium]|nr:LptF/LptG family permease [Elusimicrobiota bacterium]
MTILPRYLLRVFLPFFGLCLALFTAILLMNSFLKLFSLAVTKGISLIWILSCFSRLLPYFLGLTVPMAFLVAMLMALGQLSERGEIMALRSSGFSFREMTRPFLVVAVLLTGILLWVNHKVSPEGLHSFRGRQSYASQQLARIDLEPDSFVNLGEWRLYAKEADRVTGNIKDAYLVRAGVDRGLRVSAPSGSLRLKKGQGFVLELRNGALQLPGRTSDKFTSATFARYRLFVPLSGPVEMGRSPDTQEFKSLHLWQMARAPGMPRERRNEYLVEVSVRSAAAFSPFVFFWIGAPLGLGVGRFGKGKGFVVSLGILFVFYGLLAFGIGLGRRYDSLSFAAPWTADGVGLAIGAWLTRRASEL